MTERSESEERLVPEKAIEELDQALEESGGDSIMVIARRPSETDEEFARRVERITAVVGVEEPQIIQVKDLSLREQEGGDK